MLSIGWIIFWKVVVVAAFGFAAERYRAAKKRRREAGVVLRYDAKRSVFYDPLERREAAARSVFFALLALFVAYGVFVVSTLLSSP